MEGFLKRARVPGFVDTFKENYEAAHWYLMARRCWWRLPHPNSLPQVNEFHAQLHGDWYYFLKIHRPGKGPYWYPIHPLRHREALKRLGKIQ